ncbi:MAG: hypothetical protein GC151_12630 [Betaproteobacteria bacterium]|nr:hypothetical protein [Betaproteobacteria bacterium]
MRPIRTVLAASVLAGVLAGCTTGPRLVDVGTASSSRAADCPSSDTRSCPTGVTSAPHSDLDDVMDYYLVLRAQSGSALKQTYEVAKKDFETTGNEAARLKLALVHWLPNSPVHSDAAVAQLLEPYTRGEGRGFSELSGLAQVLLASIEMSRRADAQLQSQTARLREEQRKSDDLQHKLDALKDVERAMILKDQGVRAK